MPHPGPSTNPPVFSVISDSEVDGSGPLAYALQDQTPDSMTMTLRDKS